MTAAVRIFFFDAPLGGTLAAVGAAWVLIGGAGFLLSVLINKDVAVLFIIYLVPTLLDSMARAGAAWWWVKPVLTIVPPTHKLAALRGGLLGPTTVNTGDLTHILLYGAGCAALALWLLRRMPLVR
jgi:hypothetical protein